MSYPYQKKGEVCQRCDDGWYPAKICTEGCLFDKFYILAKSLVNSQPDRKIRHDKNTEIIMTARELANLWRFNRGE